MGTTKYDHYEIARARALGKSWQFIADELCGGAEVETLRGNHSRWKATHAFDPALESIARPAPVEEDEWPFPVRPVRVEIPSWGPSHSPESVFRVVHIPDIHVPFQDDAALDVLYAYLAENRVDGVVCHGDLVDAAEISSYVKERNGRTPLQAEIDGAALVLARITQLTPDASWRKYLEGNHENRLSRTLNAMATDRVAGEILDLREVQKALTWDNLLGLDSIGWTYHRKRELLFDTMILKHGDVVRKIAAYTARAEMDKYHKSGASGHTHRIGRVTQRDHNGTHGWWELGCLCDLDPSYTTDPNWQQGFGISEWDLTDPARPQFQMQLVDINRGRAIIGGRLYSKPAGV